MQRKSFFPHIPDEFASSIFLVFTMVPALFSSYILQILWKKVHSLIYHTNLHLRFLLLIKGFRLIFFQIFCKSEEYVLLHVFFSFLTRHSEHSNFFLSFFELSFFLIQYISSIKLKASPGERAGYEHELTKRSPYIKAEHIEPHGFHTPCLLKFLLPLFFFSSFSR